MTVVVKDPASDFVFEANVLFSRNGCGGIELKKAEVEVVTLPNGAMLQPIGRGAAWESGNWLIKELADEVREQIVNGVDRARESAPYDRADAHKSAIVASAAVA